MNADLSAMTHEQLAAWYIKNRSWMADRKADYQAAIADVESIQEQIETELQRRLNEAGATSFRTPGGTVVQSTTTAYSAEDSAAFGRFIIEHGCYEATSLRPIKEFVEDYKREHGGQLPPGVGQYSKTTLSVKKPTTSK